MGAGKWALVAFAAVGAAWPAVAGGAPVIGARVDVRPVSGHVFVKRPRSHTFVPLGTLTALPVGATVDTTRGSVELIAATDRSGGTQTGTFRGGRFVVRQAPSSPLTELRLTGGKLGSCSKRQRRLVSSVHGQFRTRGRYAAATARGTTWTMRDTCSTTTTVVSRGTVLVHEFATGRDVTVRAGQSSPATRPSGG